MIDQTPENPYIEQRWYTRHKRLLWIGFGVFSLLILLLLVGLLYVRTGKLNRFISSQVVEALAEYGLRAEIGSFNITWGIQTAKIGEIKIYNQQTGQLIATIDQAEMEVQIREPFAVQLRREIIFKRLELTNLNLRIDVDERGRSNLQGLRQAPPQAPSRLGFDFSSLVAAIRGGEAQISDRSRKIEGNLGNLELNAQPLPGIEKVKAQLATRGGRLRYEGREISLDGLDLLVTGGATGAQIEQFALRSPVMQSSASGRIDDWKAPRYNFSLHTQVTLEEIERMFEPNAGLRGGATVDAKIEGVEKAYKIDVKLSSDDLVAYGARIKGAQGAGRVDGEGSHYKVVADMSSNEIVGSGAQIHGAKIEGFKADDDGAKIRFETRRAYAQKVVAQNARLIDLSAGAIHGESAGGRIHATAPQAAVDKIEIEQGQISGVSLKTIDAELEHGLYRAKGTLAIKDAVVSGAAVGPVDGDLVADNKSISLNKFKASLFGGNASGDVAVNFERSGDSRLKATFNELITSDVFAVASTGRAPLAGRLGGDAELSWPGMDFLATSGAVKVHMKAETTQTVDAIPVTGDVSLRARGGVFDIEQFLLNTDASQIKATGQFSRDGTSDLRFSLTSKNAEQLQTIAYSIEEVRKSVESFEPQILGDFKFEGRLQGPFKDPTLEGDLNASNVLLHDEPLGALSGHLSFSPTELKFENGALAAVNGGSAKFTYSAPRDALATEGRLDATIERISADTVIAAAGLPPGQKFFSGDISGDAHLTGLPDSPKGTATINLIDGVIGGQPAELTRASLLFDRNSVRLNRAEARLPQGRLTADGEMDLKRYDFQVKGRVENLDLAALVNAQETANLAATGTLNADIRASGNARDIEQLNLELTAEGQNVTINGRQAGQLSLTARTSQNGRVDMDLITGITGKPQPAHASIELRKPGRPIEVSADLTSLDLAPLLAAFAPDLSSSIAGNIGGKLRLSGPTVNDKSEATINGLKGSLSLDSISLEVSGRSLTIQTPLTVMMNGPELRLERARVTGDGVDLALGGTLGLSEDAKLDFNINGTADLEAIARLNPDYFMDGKATVNVQLTGSFKAPQLGGEIVLDDVSFSSFDLQYNVEHGYGRLVMAGDKVTLEYFTATANDGTLKLTGVLTLDQLQPKEWRLDMSTNYAIVYYQGAQITLYGDVTLTGDPQGQSLAGLITISQAEYTSDFDLERLTSSGGDLGSGLGIGYGGSSLPRTNLDIRVEANDSILIRNEQVNTVGSASIRVAGSMTEPFITGRVSFEGGAIKFRSQRYEITAGTIDFPPGGGMSPQVNFLTEGDVSGYHVYVGLTGPINDMDVTLRSEPELARSEVLSLVTTGRADSDTLGSEDLFRSGAGTAASLLTQEFISKPAESLLGLSRFQIDPIFRPNSNPAARLTIGRQLARNLAFTYSTNLGSEQDQTALTEYTLTNRFSGIASYTQGGTSTRGGNKDSDFTIEFRGRRRFSLGFESADSSASNPVRASKAPPRREREPLPRAEVSILKPDVVKLSDKRLRELAPVMKEGFSLPLARLGERNLTNYLQENGYFFATVRSHCQPIECVGPNLKLFYDVEPGQRLDLERIRLEGAERISLGDVSGEFQTKAKSVVGSVPFFKNLPWIGGLARGVTSNDRLQHDREVVRRHMVDLGFRSARVGSRLAFNPESEDLTVIFSVEEGPRSTIADVMFRGNSVLAVDELRKAAPVKDEEAFSPALIRSGTTNIKKLYTDQGYLDAVVSAEVVDLPNDQVRLIYSVQEGSKNVVSEVVISGQTKTHEASIRRFLSFDTGDTLTPDLIRQTQRDLYATGAFREVTVRAEPKPGEDESARRISLGVTEAKPLLFVYGLGYSTDEGPRGLAQVSDTNLFGRVNSASIRMRASRREQLAQFSYTDLRPFGTKWATTLSTFYDRNTNLQTIQRKQIVDGEVQIQDPQSFGINRFAAFIQTERKLSEKSALRFRYSFENARLTNAQNIPIGEIGRNNRSIRLGSFSIGLTRDTRDSALTPTRGQLMSAEHTVAARIFGGNEAFNRFFGTYQAYKTFEPSTPFIRDSTFAFSARIGLAAPFRVPMTNTLDDKLLPISERFFAGGATTLRGFRFEQAGPQIILESTRPGELPALVPRGGNALTVFNFEFRYPLTRRVRLVPFYDVGNVFLQVRDIRFKDMSNTIGLGLRFNTPIGPVGVDYGYLLNPPSFVTQGNAILRRPHGAIHIRFGQSF
ncbi:MAG TPA: translocation/assembly module TamB domain-containing protein [Blastocatellia bacterium]|nr:translocation/assembly module TamB domain-containing protein [Blastocatellia bacterium]